MRFDIVVMRLVNDQPPHIHVRESGIKEAKVERMLLSTTADEYERLERSPKDIVARFDGETPTGGFVMSRLLRGGATVTTQVEAVKHGSI